MRQYHVVLSNGEERDIMAEAVRIDGSGALVFSNGAEAIVMYNREAWLYAEVERQDDRGE